MRSYMRCAFECISLIALSIVMLGAFGALTSCSRKQVEFIETIDTLIVEKIDTVHSEKGTHQSVKEKRESTSNRFVVVTVAGDTVKDYRTEYVYVEKDSTLVDSLAKYKAMYNNLKKSKSNVRDVQIKVPPSIWDMLEYFYIGIVVGSVLCFYAFYFYRKKWRKLS